MCTYALSRRSCRACALAPVLPCLLAMVQKSDVQFATTLIYTIYRQSTRLTPSPQRREMRSLSYMEVSKLRGNLHTVPQPGFESLPQALL